MVEIIAQSEAIIESTPIGFTRYLTDHIRWNNRLIGLIGARGTGKTTMLLQWLREQNLPAKHRAYFSLDDLYFTQHSLKETAVAFYKGGGKILVLDEVHKYKTWAQEIKILYDFYPKLQIVFTGSSIIDIAKQQGDLSRRALIYELPGLSFREYLRMMGIADIQTVKLGEILQENPKKLNLPDDFRPLEHFKEYLRYGYYPFVIEDPDSVHHKINQMIRTAVEYDMAELPDFDVRNARKLLQLIYIIAQQVPFKPNLSALAQKTAIHRNSLNHYLHLLERARIISMLYPFGNSTATLRKPEKIFLNNTNLHYSLAEEGVQIGTVRETFFLSQLRPSNKIALPKQGDFILNGKYTVEIGGKGKDRKQIRGIKNAWLVRDDIDAPAKNVLPLWMFGLLY